MVKNQRNSCCHMGCPPMIGDLHFHRGYSLRLQESKPLKNDGIISYATPDLLKAHRVAQALRDGDEILDVGCGNAHLLRELALFRSFHRRMGLDLTVPQHLTIPGVELGVYDGQTLPFPNRSFDAVIFGYVLHYLTREHAVRLLSEACRIARRQVILLEDSLPHFSV